MMVRSSELSKLFPSESDSKQLVEYAGIVFAPASTLSRQALPAKGETVCNVSLFPLAGKKSPRGISTHLCAPEELQAFAELSKTSASHYWATAWQAIDEGLLTHDDIEHSCWAALERVACLSLLRAMHHLWANVPTTKLNLHTLPVHDGCKPEVLAALRKAHVQAKLVSGKLGALNALREGVIERIIDGHQNLEPRFRSADPYVVHAAANPRVQAAVDVVYRAVRAAVNSSWPSCGAALNRMWPDLAEAVQGAGPDDATA